MKKFLSLLLLGIFLNFQLICMADSLTDNVNVTLEQIPLSSKLKKEYNGYKYTVVNNSNQNINVVNAQIINAVNGSVAHQSVNDGHPIGITWAICGPVGLFTLGIGWLVGIVATPIVWAVAEKNTKKSQKESIAYPNIVNLGKMAKGESIEASFLVPIGTKPQLKMTVQPEKSSELVPINSL